MNKLGCAHVCGGSSPSGRAGGSECNEGYGLEAPGKIWKLR